MKMSVVHKQAWRLAHEVAVVGCMVVDQSCIESNRKAKIMGYKRV